jgi:hypothetical protein
MTQHRGLFARVLLSAAIIAVVWCLHAPAAHASRAPFESGLQISGGDLSAGLLAASALVFGSIDLVYLARDRPLPIGLTILQITVAGMLVPLTSVDTGRVDVQIGAVISSAWFAGHGIYSLLAYSELERKRAEGLAAERKRRLVDCAKGTEPALFCRRWR